MLTIDRRPITRLERDTIARSSRCDHSDQTLRRETAAIPGPTPRRLELLEGSEHWECDDCGATFLGPLDLSDTPGIWV